MLLISSTSRYWPVPKLLLRIQYQTIRGNTSLLTLPWLRDDKTTFDTRPQATDTIAHVQYNTSRLRTYKDCRGRARRTLPGCWRRRQHSLQVRRREERFHCFLLRFKHKSLAHHSAHSPSTTFERLCTLTCCSTVEEWQLRVVAAKKILGQSFTVSIMVMKG